MHETRRYEPFTRATGECVQMNKNKHELCLKRRYVRETQWHQGVPWDTERRRGVEVNVDMGLWEGWCAGNGAHVEYFSLYAVAAVGGDEHGRVLPRSISMGHA